MRRDTFPETALKADVAVDVEVVAEEETATTAANPVTFLAIAPHPAAADAAAVVAETATTAVNQAISLATAPSQEAAAAVAAAAAATATCSATSAKAMDTCPANAPLERQLTTKS